MCTVVCRVEEFVDMSTHEIEEKVLEKAEAIFLKMVGLRNPAPTSISAATTKAVAQLAMLSLKLKKVVERLVAPKVTLDQLDNAIPLSLWHELKAMLQSFASKGTLPWQ